MHDTIIIGAGAAGLAAGQRLRAAGRAPLILEARDRIGGRICTDRTHGPVELGAEFIHGEHAATWEFVRAAGLRTSGWSDEGRRFAKGGVIFPAADPVADRTVAIFDAAVGYHGPEISVAALIDGMFQPNDIARTFALRWLANLESADTSLLSASALTREREIATNGEANFHILDGYDRLVAHMAQGLDIRLGQAVERVAWDEAGVAVEVAGGARLAARDLIITVPVGVLQAGRPAFDPPLPEAKRAAIAAIAVGHVVKLMLWFDRQRWPDFVVLSTDGRIATWWTVESAATPTIMGYVGGPAALEIAALGEQGAITLGLSELSQLLGFDAAGASLGGRLSGWSADPWSLGAYTYSPVGVGAARAVLAAPHGWLHFAGEATLTNGHIATVHGAIESGRRAADEVLAAAREP
jgi:monoamine oxidase